MDDAERLIATAALASPDRARAAWREWRASVPIAEATGLLVWAGGYIHRNLATAGVDEPYLAGIYRHNLIANTTRLRAALPVLRELARSWPIAPLKSFGMSGATYSRGLRPLADFDFWVDPDHAHAVGDFLEQRGLHPILSVSAHEFEHRVLPQRGSWNYVSAQGVDLDLHWRLLEHLDHATSRRLVEQNSTLVQTEVGTVRQLSQELMVSCLVAHFRLQGNELDKGLFDVADLIERVEVGRAAELAAEAGLARELLQTVQQISALAEGDHRPALRAFERALAPAAAEQAPLEYVEAPERGEAIPARFDTSAYLRYPRLYRWWTARGRPAWVERAITRWAGGFTPVPSAQQRAVEPPRVFPTEAGILGTGWHYRYPYDQHRWANLPDARVLFVDAPRSVTRVRIELSAPEWAVSPGGAITVRVNGRVVGTMPRETHVAEFAVRAARRLEISLRPEGDRRHTGAGLLEQWFRMLAPVRFIELI